MNNPEKTITYKGVTLTVSQWAAKLKINYHTLARRQKFKWSAKKILTPPLPRATNTRVTPDTILKIRRLFRMGFKRAELSVIFKKDNSTIFHHTRDLNIKGRPLLKPGTQEEKELFEIIQQKRNKIKATKLLNAHTRCCPKQKTKKYKEYLAESKKRDKINAKKKRPKGCCFLSKS